MKILITGHNGLVGSAILRLHRQLGFEDKHELLYAIRSEVDWSDETQARWFFSCHRPTHVYHCAAWVGGIMAHSNDSVSAILNNSAIQNNVISLSAEYGVEKLLFLGSACAYPRRATVPISESELGTGPLESSNKGYALCKLLGHELCAAYRREQGMNFISCIPTNVYGLNDKYDLQRSHVIPGMIHRIHKAKVEGRIRAKLWGTGNAVREFIWADDLARACFTLMDLYNDECPVNLGSGEYLDLKTLAHLVSEAVGFDGKFDWDTSKPDGTPVRFLDNLKILSLGWKPRVPLSEGLPLAYSDFLKKI